MNGLETAEKLSKKYDMTIDEFLFTSSKLMLKEKKKKLQNERFEILSHYQISTIEEFEKKIENGEIPEHPSWEDLIELKNIEAEIKDIDRDIQSIQAA